MLTQFDLQILVHGFCRGHSRIGRNTVHSGASPLAWTTQNGKEDWKSPKIPQCSTESVKSLAGTALFFARSVVWIRSVLTRVLLAILNTEIDKAQKYQ